jgi:dihydrodipicolinate synthase/N-acetylneuraminate lyase
MAVPEGIYASSITPRRRGVQDINLGAMWELIDFLCSRRVDGIVLLGHTGEFMHFSPSERMRMTGLAPRRSRVPVIINVSHSTLDGCVELAQAASSSGAAAVLLTPPGFYSYDQETIRTFFMRFSEEAGVPVPVLLYQFPQCVDGCSFEVFRDLVRQRLIHGIADTSRNTALPDTFLALRREVPFTIMTGDAQIVGMDRNSHAISAAACVVPELMTASFKSENVRPLAAEFLKWTGRMPAPVAIKEALAVRGLKPGPHAVPLSPSHERIVGEFREWFRGWLPGALKECEHA